MNVAMRKVWTQEAFFAWAETQEGHWEFDGIQPVQPVGMVGGTFTHATICRNVLVSLSTRLRGTLCQALGSEAGVATIGSAVRYPDALVTCAKNDGKARIVAGVVVVFEVISPSTSKVDRFDKVREYAGVDTVRRYVIVESDFVGVTVFERDGAGEGWRSMALGEDGVLAMGEIGVEVAVAAFYEGVEFVDAGGGTEEG